MNKTKHLSDFEFLKMAFIRAIPSASPFDGKGMARRMEATKTKTPPTKIMNIPELTPAEKKVIEAFRRGDESLYCDLFEEKHMVRSSVTERQYSSVSSEEPFDADEAITLAVIDKGFTADHGVIAELVNELRSIAWILSAKATTSTFRQRFPQTPRLEAFLRHAYPEKKSLREEGEKAGMEASSILRSNRSVLKFFGVDVAKQLRRQKHATPKC